MSIPNNLVYICYILSFSGIFFSTIIAHIRYNGKKQMYPYNRSIKESGKEKCNRPLSETGCIAIGMIRKIFYGIMGGAVLLSVGFVFGLIVGAIIGGNFFTGFEFGEIRGYEAVGNISAMVGSVIGFLFGMISGVKLADEKVPRAYRLVLTAVFIILVLLAVVFILFR